jgi:hypothetical protein
MCQTIFAFEPERLGFFLLRCSYAGSRSGGIQATNLVYLRPRPTLLTFNLPTFLCPLRSLPDRLNRPHLN